MQCAHLDAESQAGGRSVERGEYKCATPTSNQFYGHVQCCHVHNDCLVPIVMGKTKMPDKWQRRIRVNACVRALKMNSMEMKWQKIHSVCHAITASC